MSGDWMNHEISGPWRSTGVFNRCEWEWECKICGLRVVKRGRENVAPPLLPNLFNEIDCDTRLIEVVMKA